MPFRIEFYLLFPESIALPTLMGEVQQCVIWKGSLFEKGEYTGFEKRTSAKKKARDCLASSILAELLVIGAFEKNFLAPRVLFNVSDEISSLEASKEYIAPLWDAHSLSSIPRLSLLKRHNKRIKRTNPLPKEKFQNKAKRMIIFSGTPLLWFPLKTILFLLDDFVRTATVSEIILTRDTSAIQEFERILSRLRNVKEESRILLMFSGGN